MIVLVIFYRFLIWGFGGVLSYNNGISDLIVIFLFFGKIMGLLV